jgi:hypothetical protein
VVPGFLDGVPNFSSSTASFAPQRSTTGLPPVAATDNGDGEDGEEGDDGSVDYDSDVLEIPIFVRLEFEADVNAEERGLGDSRGAKGEREKREEAFWTVVGVGRIAG